MMFGEMIEHREQNAQAPIWTGVINQSDRATALYSGGSINRLDTVQHHLAFRPGNIEVHDKMLHLPIADKDQPVKFPPASVGEMLDCRVAGSLVNPQDAVLVLAQFAGTTGNDLKFLQQPARNFSIIKSRHGGFSPAAGVLRYVRDLHEIEIVVGHVAQVLIAVTAKRGVKGVACRALFPYHSRRGG